MNKIRIIYYLEFVHHGKINANANANRFLASNRIQAFHKPVGFSGFTKHLLCITVIVDTATEWLPIFRRILTQCNNSTTINIYNGCFFRYYHWVSRFYRSVLLVLLGIMPLRFHKSCSMNGKT